MVKTNQSSPNVTPVVQREECERWAAHVARLQLEGSVSKNVLDAVLLMTAAHCIGFAGGGFIRPGEIGRWDVYEMLLQYIPMATKIERACAANISDDELQREEGDQEMYFAGLEPTDTAQVDEFRRLQGLGDEELAAHVAQLQGVLEAMS